jgi:hypothetical protein
MGCGSSAPTEGAPTEQVVVDLFEADINLENFCKLLKNPTTTAVRLHGSRHVQTMLEEASDLQQMDVVVAFSSSPQNNSPPRVPVVVLVGGDEDNTRACAKFTLLAWKSALARVGHNQDDIPCKWFVSNHSYAVSMTAMDTQVPQALLPPGCKE